MSCAALGKGAETRLERLILVLVVSLLMIVFVSSSSRAAGKPQRIVSLNMCLDELVLRLADPDKIASVSWYSQDPANANMAEAAKRHPANHGSAEEAMFFRPDLVLVGRFTPRPTREMLKAIGAPVVQLDVPETLADVRKQIREVAGLVGEPARGDALVARMDRDLDAISLDPRLPKLKAIILRPNGYTVGPGSLVDELLARAGLDNMAARLDIGAYQQISLERVALLDADVLIANAESTGAPSLATEGLRHPLVQALGRKLRVVAVPARYWTCAGPAIVDAVRQLVEAAKDIRTKGLSP